MRRREKMKMPKQIVKIIYQDGDIIVIDKASGVSVTKDRTGSPQLLDLLRHQIDRQTATQLRLVHRLDKDTSGIVLLAKNKKAQTALCRMFENKLVKKTYLALVRGAAAQTSGTIDLPLLPDPKEPNRMCTAKKGKKAVTEWRLLADFGTVKLLTVYPLTGRTHQIRVHLSAVGLPLAIDPLYSSAKPLYLSEFKTDYRLGKGRDEIPLIERLTLHAYQIVIPAQNVLDAAAGAKITFSPVTPAQPAQSGLVLTNIEGVEGAEIQTCCFIAPLDKKFAATLKMLTKHNAHGLAAWTDPDCFSAIIRAQQLV
jgi:RluA family pseudouridine synthase